MYAGFIKVSPVPDRGSYISRLDVSKVGIRRSLLVDRDIDSAVRCSPQAKCSIPVKVCPSSFASQVESTIAGLQYAPGEKTEYGDGPKSQQDITVRSQ